MRSRAALDRDAETLYAFERAELGHARAYPGRTEFSHHQLCDMLSQRFDQQKTILRKTAFDVRDHLGVVDGLRDFVRAG